MAEFIRYAGDTAVMLTHRFDFSLLCGGKAFAFSLGRVMMKLSHGILSGSVISTAAFCPSFLTWDSFFIVALSFYNEGRNHFGYILSELHIPLGVLACVFKKSLDIYIRSCYYSKVL